MSNSRGKSHHPYKKIPLVDSIAQKPTEELSPSLDLEANTVCLNRTEIQTENRCRIEKTFGEPYPKGLNGMKATRESPSPKTTTGDKKTREETSPLLETGNKASFEGTSPRHSTQHLAIHKGPSTEGTSAYDGSQFEFHRHYELANVEDGSPPIDISVEEAGIEEKCEARKVDVEECMEETGQNDQIPETIDLTDDTSTGDFTKGEYRGNNSEDDRSTVEEQNNNLPNGWVEVLHNSGVTICWNEEIKMITVGRPYMIGSDSVRKHHVPTVAIPCLARLLGTTEGSLSNDDLHAYLKRRFRFKTFRLVHHSSWKNRRAYESIVKRYRLARSPWTVHLPVGRTGALVPFSLSNKTFVTLLAEYVGLATRGGTVEYETRPAGAGHGAVAIVGGARYGRGVGTSKRGAREAAARHALDAMLPDRRRGPDAAGDPLERLPVDDPRVPRACRHLCLPPPTAVLRAAVDAHDALRGLPVDEDVVADADGRGAPSFRARVGPYAARARCRRGKAEGRQRAAQALLAKIHPLVRCWAGLVRLYGDVVVSRYDDVDAYDDLVAADTPADPELQARLRRAMSAMARRGAATAEQIGDIHRFGQDCEERAVRKDLLFPAGPFDYTPPSHFHQ